MVVEGVETEHEALVAIAANADMLQGFYFARPQARIDAEQGFATTFDNLLRGQQWKPERLAQARALHEAFDDSAPLCEVSPTHQPHTESHPHP